MKVFAPCHDRFRLHQACPCEAHGYLVQNTQVLAFLLQRDNIAYMPILAVNPKVIDCVVDWQGFFADLVTGGKDSGRILDCWWVAVLDVEPDLEGFF